MRAILDTNILIEHPNIVRFASNKVSFLIPDAVHKELLHRVRPELANSYSGLLNSLLLSPYVKVLSTPHELPSLSVDSRLSHADIVVLATALEYAQHTDDKAVFVTDDIALLRSAQQEGLTCLTGRQFLQSLAGGPRTGPAESELSEVNRLSRLYLTRGILIGIFITLAIVTVVMNIEVINQTVRLWGFVLIVMLAGPAWYLFRIRSRLVYGVVETLVGLITALRLTGTTTFDVPYFLQLFAGLYLVVAGLDNVGRGLMGTKYHDYWRRIFRNGSRSNQ